MCLLHCGVYQSCAQVQVRGCVAVAFWLDTSDPISSELRSSEWLHFSLIDDIWRSVETPQQWLPPGRSHFDLERGILAPASRRQRTLVLTRSHLRNNEFALRDFCVIQLCVVVHRSASEATSTLTTLL